MQVIIFIGIQASGKSTFFAQNFVDTHVRINLDMLRTRHREKCLIETCLDIGQSFAVDNTNPSAADRKRYIEPALKRGVQVVGYYFQSKLADALKRDRQRPSDKQIPEKGIRGTLSRLEMPAYSEGFEHLYFVRMDGNGGFEIEAWQDEI